MNRKMVFYMLGQILKLEAALLSLPLLCSVIYSEKEVFSILITIAVALALGFILTVFNKAKDKTVYAKEGFVIVALSWLVLSAIGALPFVISGAIPSYVDAFFETVSGFTTTGASILPNVESITSKGLLFWRSFTHWIGGMGVLVFLLAVIPLTDGTHMHIMRAESPGPSVDKLLPKLRQTAMVLYAIYFTLTIAELIFLLAGRMPVFDAVTAAFGTAGTGGFAVKADSMAGYSPYIQWVVGVFMMLFGINFSFYFLLLIRKFRQAFSFEEVRSYILIIIGATAAIMLSIYFNGCLNNMGFADKLRHTFFQVSSIMTTTGFITIDYDTLWPETGKTILVILMFVGACAGSTGGGIKVSRVTMLFKTIKKEITLFFHPKRVVLIKNERKTVAHETIRTTNVFIMAYIFVFVLSVLLITIDNFNFTTSFTAVAATLNNIGPGLSEAGPTESFSNFSVLSKYVMIFDMLAGRLEIFPMILIFTKEFRASIFMPNRTLIKKG